MTPRRYNKMSIYGFSIAIISVLFYFLGFKYRNELFYNLSVSGYFVAYILSITYLIRSARNKTNEKGFFLSMLVIVFPLIMFFYALTHIRLG